MFLGINAWMTPTVSWFPELLSHLRDLLGPVLPAPAGEPNHFFTSSELARLHHATDKPGSGALDEQTWDDLLLGQYADSLSDKVSIFGRQELHRRLRAGLDDVDCAAQVERVRAWIADRAGLAAVQRSLLPLRHAEHEIADLLFVQTAPAVPRWVRWSWLLPVALLASLVPLVMWPFGWVATLCALYPLFALQIRFHARAEPWKATLDSVQRVLAVCHALGASEHPLLAHFRPLRSEAGRLGQRLARPVLERMVPGASSYADWFCAANVTRYFTTLDQVFRERDFLQRCFLQCAELEADSALARHLAQAPLWCWAGRSDARTIALTAGVHPLMERAAPLSISLAGKGAFISGQNASGKSTFLRMLGLNLVAARAFGFCYAQQARLPALPVYASMHNEDSLLGGDSLYMAELRRAKELLAAADGPHPGICLIDEIFRGTNHVESVSAAAAVLDTLAAKSLVVVSSHNLVLATLLAHHLDPYFISLGHDVMQLEAGVLAHTNGIALLATQGFGKRVEDKAGKVAQWLSSYLAQPASAVGVLHGPNGDAVAAERLQA
jgi:hypothetical protein